MPYAVIYYKDTTFSPYYAVVIASLERYPQMVGGE